MSGFSRRSFLGRAAGLGSGAIGIGAVALPNPSLGQGTGTAPTPLILGEAKGAGQSAQFVIGAKGGLFKKHDLDVSLRIFGSGAEMGPALVAGSLNSIATGDVPAIPIMAAGAPIKALCPVSDFSADQAIVTKTSIKEPGDLIGKKIALYKGSVATLLIDRYAAHHKLDINKISLIHMDAVQQPPALASGDIDGYVSWEPHIWSGLKRIPGAHVLARANEPVEYMKVYDLLLVREDYLKANPEAVKRLLTSLAEGMDMLHSKDPTALEKVGAYIREAQGVDLPIPALVEMMHRRIYTMTVDKSFIETQKTNTEFLRSLGRIKSSADPMSWFEFGPLRAVRPDLVTI